MKIANLIIMQEVLSEVDQLKEMVKFVAGGGFFTKIALEQYSGYNKTRDNFSKTRLISITKFEDGGLFIHDGHHRIGAILMAGRDFLRKDEYTVNEMQYAQYDEINPSVGFVTPFVPTEEIRLSNFSEFKDIAIELFEKDESNKAVFFIRNNRHSYCRPREMVYVKDLIKGISC